jgi:hypothetical protein
MAKARRRMTEKTSAGDAIRGRSVVCSFDLVTGMAPVKSAAGGGFRIAKRSVKDRERSQQIL